MWRGRWVRRAPWPRKWWRGVTERRDGRGEDRMSDSCATTPPPPSSGDYANVIINCQCSLFNDSSSRLLNTPNHRYVTKIAIQVHRCVSKLLILQRRCAVGSVTRSFPFSLECPPLFAWLSPWNRLPTRRGGYSSFFIGLLTAISAAEFIHNLDEPLKNRKIK